MPSPLPDLRDFYDPALTLTVGGKEYRVEPPSQKQTLAVRAVINGAKVPDREYLDRIFALLGAARDVDDTYSGGLVDEMTSDGLVWAEVLRVAETAAIHYGDGATEARAWWSAELLAEALAANPEAVEVLTSVAPTEAPEGDDSEGAA